MVVDSVWQWPVSSVVLYSEELNLVDEYEHNKFCCRRSFGTVSSSTHGQKNNIHGTFLRPQKYVVKRMEKGDYTDMLNSVVVHLGKRSIAHVEFDK